MDDRAKSADSATTTETERAPEERRKKFEVGRPRKGEAHFIMTQGSKRIYYVDRNGTRRNLTAEQREYLRKNGYEV